MMMIHLPITTTAAHQQATRPQFRPVNYTGGSDSTGRTWVWGWVPVADCRHWWLRPLHSLWYSAVFISRVVCCCSGWGRRAIGLLPLLGEMEWGGGYWVSESIKVWQKSIWLGRGGGSFIKLCSTCWGGALIWSFRISMASSWGSGFLTNVFTSFLSRKKKWNTYPTNK